MRDAQQRRSARTMAGPRRGRALGCGVGLLGALCLLAGACKDRERPSAAPGGAPSAGARTPGAPTGGADESGVAAVAGPSAPPDPAVVRELVVHDLTPAALRVVDLSEDVDDIVRASLAQTKRVVVADDPAAAPDGYSLGFGIIYHLVVDGTPVREPTKGSLIVMVQVDMGRRRAGALSEVYDARALETLPYDPATDGALEPLVRGQVERAVDGARGRLVAQLRLAGGSDAAVLAMLRDPDPLVRAAAAREAGERELKGAVEPLVAALDAEQPELRLAALGALGRIRDEAAVPAVAQRTSGNDLDEIRTAVFVLGDIGGPKARRYLESIAEAHPVPEIQAAAKAALGEP